VNQAQDKAQAPALDVDSILAIHPDPAGYIGFVRKVDPAAPPRLDKNGKPYLFENLFSIQAAELRSMFPALAEWLTHDSYFTVNAYYRAAHYTNKTTGLPDVYRKEKHLRTLNACYADIDSGRPESDEPGAALDWRAAQHEAENAADLGIIPHPSIMARSGRGVYLFWLLRDEKDPEKLPHAWPEKIELYKACNRALVQRLQDFHLPADPKAIDAARVLRVPGSIHRKAMRRVGYVIQLDEHGKGFTYTLPELAAALDLNSISCDLPDQARRLARPATYRRAKEKGKAPLRSHGVTALNSQRAQDLLTLSTWRGGFLKRGAKYPDGSTSPGRKWALSLYANFLRGSGVDQAEALAAVLSMASTMRPPYPSDTPDQDPPIETIVAAEYAEAKRRRWSNAKLCPLLGVTAAVARELALQTIRPLDVALEADQARPLQADVIAARRTMAAQYIEMRRLTHGIPTARKLASFYAAHDLPGANHETANQDMQALGYVSTRSTGGRPRKAAL